MVAQLRRGARPLTPGAACYPGGGKNTPYRIDGLGIPPAENFPVTQ